MVCSKTLAPGQKEKKTAPLDKKETGFPIVFMTSVKSRTKLEIFSVMLLVTRWTLQSPGYGLGQLSSELRSIFD